MNFYVRQTDALGDFLNCMPILSGLNKKFGKYNLIVKNQTKKFKGFREFLLYQDLFENVYFDDEFKGETIPLDNWGEDRIYRLDENRPRETCKYENFLRDVYKVDFHVDDDFLIKCPKMNIEVDPNTYYVGDRWDHPSTDKRRNFNLLSHLDNYKFIDYNVDLLTNCYIVSQLQKPLITTFTGIGIMSDLMNKETIIVWDDDMLNFTMKVWNKPVQYDFENHYYMNRKSKLIHINDLKNIL